jgi:hypothetical protein
MTELQQVDVDVHVEGKLPPSLLLLGLWVQVSLVERAGDALSLGRRGREGGKEGRREGGRDGIRNAVRSFLPAPIPSLTKSSLGRLEEISDRHW